MATLAVVSCSTARTRSPSGQMFFTLLDDAKSLIGHYARSKAVQDEARFILSIAGHNRILERSWPQL